MTTGTWRTFVAFGGLAWLVVAVYGVLSSRVDDGDSWEGPYLVFTAALMIGAVLVVGAAAMVTQNAERRRLRMAGLIVSGFGVALTLVAWAIPVWMTVLGVGLALIAGAAGPSARRAVAVLAAAQLVGLVALFVGIAIELGEADSYGDYPAAAGLALIVTAAFTIFAIVELMRGAETHVQNQTAFS